MMMLIRCLIVAVLAWICDEPNDEMDAYYEGLL
jgi:hypothetical protein